MAEKHKTKYKAPKDEAKSQKPETRKDIKDYTAPDADGMVPNLSKGIQKLVPRNINGEVIDNIENMVPKIKDHIYKKVEEGDYDPAYARKVFEKLQIEDSKGYLDAMENGVYKMNESQKEQVIRKYIRNKIAKILRENYVMEQDDPEPAADTPADTPADAPADAPEPAADAPADAPETDAPEDDAAADTGADLGGGAPIGGGGGGGSTPSPSPTPAAPAATDDSAETDSEPVPIDATETNLDNTSKKFESDFKKFFNNATPVEAGAKMAKIFLSLLKGRSNAKNKEFIGNFFAAAAESGTNMKSIARTPPSDDITKNQS